MTRLRPGQHLATRSGRSLLIQEWRAEGSYARIYRAELRGGWTLGGPPASDCAVKVARAEIEDAAGYLERERDALERGPFTNVVELLDGGDAGAPFLVLSWLEGTTLRELVAQRRQLPLAQSLCIFRDAAAAVEALHAGGVAHADLRSDNVLTLAGGAGARLLDLGSARFRSAPGFPAACRQDQERLGDLLHLMLTGAPPTSGAARLSTATGHHPQAVALFEATRNASSDAAELLQRSDSLLARLGAAVARLR